MTIWADVREPKEIVDLIKSKGYQVEITSLPIGDYTFGEVCIERKSTADFLRTLYSSRMWDQAFNMMRSYRKPIFLIEGGFIYPYDSLTRKKFISMSRAIGRLIARFNSSVVMTSDIQMSSSVIASIYHASESKGGLKPVQRKGKTREEILENKLVCLPGVGRVTAKLLIKKFKSLLNIMNSTPEELSSLKGINLKRGERILRLLREDVV